MSPTQDGGDGGETDSSGRSFPLGLSSRQAFVLVMVVGLLGPGFLVAALNSMNLSNLGTVVWAVGYGGTVLVLWYGWLRPLNLAGPVEQEIPSTETPENGTDETDETASDGDDSAGTDTSKNDKAETEHSA